jgi:hypothetical protein
MNWLAERNVQTLKLSWKQRKMNHFQCMLQCGKLLFDTEQPNCLTTKLQLYLQHNIHIQLDEACSEHWTCSRVQTIRRGWKGANSMLHQKPSSMEAGYKYPKFLETPLPSQIRRWFYIFKRHVNQLRKTKIPTHQQVALQPPWIGLPNLEASLQQLYSWNN